MDILLAKALVDDSNISRKNSQETDEHDADALFCKSLIPSHKKIKGKRNRKLKIEIEMLFLKYEIGDDDDSF